MSFSTRQKGHQYCELGFPKGTVQGNGSASLPADKENKCTKVSRGQVRITPSCLPLCLMTDQPPALVRYLHVALGTFFSSAHRAQLEPQINQW